MRAECSELRHTSATVWKFSVIFALALSLGSLACSTTWTGGIGAILGKNNDTGRLFVRDTPAGMGAANGGVLPGDEVIAIDGAAVKGLTREELHKALSGKVGTKVKLTLLRAGVTVECTVERGPYKGV
jgi:C-terminal processing protease CtpA/Prc